MDASTEKNTPQSEYDSSEDRERQSRELKAGLHPLKGFKVMSALDFIKSDDTSDVVFEDAPTVPGENVVVRTSEQRFEGSGYVSVENVKGFTKSNVPKPSTRRLSRRLLKATPQSTSTEPVDLSDDIEVSEDQAEAEVEKEKELVVRGKKVRGKKGVATPVQESSSRDVEGLNPEGTYVPSWLVKNDDTFKDAAVCEDALSHLAPPSVREAIAEMDDDTMLSRMVLTTCNLAAMLPQGITRFRQRMREYEDFSKKKDKMKSSLASMKKEVAGFAEKEAAWKKEIEDLKKMHAIEMGDLKKSFEANLLKLKADREALSVQQKAFREEKEGLKASVGQVTADNQWLIEHGFQQVVTYLLHSKEFNSALGDVYTKLLNLGKHQGLTAGYKLHESGQPLEKSPMYRPEASDVFKASVEQMERLTYPYIHEVSSCFGKPLSVLQGLKPEGLNEKVCAEVLGSLSRKRSYSGDSDDTLSSLPETSKDAGLETSAVGGEEGVKAKKTKKAKKSKVLQSLCLSVYHQDVNKFVFWYTRRTPGVRTQTSYEDNIKQIMDFSTVEGFWVCYCHLARPSSLPSPTDLHLFKQGIRPLWEDAANCNGGKWIIRFKKAVSGRFWEDLVLALVGDQLDYSDNICGIVLSIRFNEDILSVWNRNASDNQVVMALRDNIKRHLKLPHGYVMEYKPHDASLRDNSSYRNTWLRG
ncbi:putative translation Initiation factor eIF-4e, eukaryotic translation initiation factor 4E (eIF-4E) [Helianthus annuus]|nr:putative translation Initiation factor eIF-4e, eukaryotic translation initiation factor 4E (eIF-4E) [Helianthus annuus]